MSGYPSLWTPEADADLIRRRTVLHQKWHDIAFIMKKSRRNVVRRYGQIVEPVRRGPRRQPLHEELGILTHVHRQAILSDRVGQWDEVTEVWSFNHLFRESITLAGAAA